MKNFATCHSHPQSLDSGSTPEAFAEREVELDSGAITCTDHGTLQACRAIYDLGKANKLIPVLGLEGYLRDDNCPILLANGYQRNANGAFVDAPKYMHFCAHALDQAAYECMVRLLSRADAQLEAAFEKMEAKDRKHGSERKPLFTWADLEELGQHNVTMTTGCMIGVVQRHLLDNDDLKTATGYFEKMKSLVKPGNLYVELNPHDTSKNWVEGVFLTMKDGTKLRFYAEKKLMTNVGEVMAKELAMRWGKSDHKTLKSVKDYKTWREMPEQEIELVQHIEDFIPNECRPWAPDGDLQAGLNKAMRALARKYGVKILIGDDSHYAHAEEKVVQDVRLAQNGSWRFYGSYHRQSSEEALEAFQRKLSISREEFGDWVENTHEWAGRFKDFVFETPPSLPTKFYEEKYVERPWFKVDSEDNSLRYTLELVKKHGRMNWNDPKMVARFKEEIKLLHNNGTIDLLPYFMVDEEVCSFYEDQGLLTGPGRGSAAGLLLTYLLGITHVDPIRYDLSVERFITQDRIASGGLPDIDQDLPQSHRDMLIDPETGWLKKRFGDHVAQISTDSTLKMRMAVRDVSRMKRGGVPPDIEAMAKKFPQPPQNVNDYNFVVGYYEDDGETWVDGKCKSDPVIMEYIAKYPEDWEIVQKCLGLARQKGRHACYRKGEAILVVEDEQLRWTPIEQCDGKTIPTGQGATVKATLLDQGSRPVMEYLLDNGKIMRCTPDHKLLTERGWMEAQQAFEQGVELLIAPETVDVFIPSSPAVSSQRPMAASASIESTWDWQNICDGAVREDMNGLRATSRSFTIEPGALNVSVVSAEDGQARTGGTR